MSKRKAKFDIIVEMADNGYWGRLKVKDNLVVAEAETIELLKSYFTDYLNDNYNLINIEIEIQYDLSAFFHEFSFLNISEVAKLANINSSLLRQYVTGAKNPSYNQLNKIENALRQIGARLAKIRLNS